MHTNFLLLNGKQYEKDIKTKIKQKFFTYLKNSLLEDSYKIEKKEKRLRDNNVVVICPNLKRGTLKDIKNIMELYFENLEQKIAGQKDLIENIFLFSENALRYNYNITEKRILQSCEKLNAAIKSNKKSKNYLLFCVEQKSEDNRYYNMAYLLDGENTYFVPKKIFTTYDYKRLKIYSKRENQEILIDQWGEPIKTKDFKANELKFLDFYLKNKKKRVEYRICADAIGIKKLKKEDKAVLLVSAKGLAINIQMKLFANVELYDQIIVNDGDDGIYKLKIEGNSPDIKGPDKEIFVSIQNNDIKLSVFYL